MLNGSPKRVRIIKSTVSNVYPFWRAGWQFLFVFLLLVDCYSVHGWMLLLLFLLCQYTLYFLHELPQKHTLTLLTPSLLQEGGDTDTYTRDYYSVDCLCTVLTIVYVLLSDSFIYMYIYSIFFCFVLFPQQCFGVETERGTLFGYLIFGPRCGCFQCLK